MPEEEWGGDEEAAAALREPTDLQGLELFGGGGGRRGGNIDTVREHTHTARGGQRGAGWDWAGREHVHGHSKAG